jgi:hypothetical protein
MPTRIPAVALLLAVATASLGAQPRGGRRGPGFAPGGPGRGGASPIGATADFLLAHTGDLALTDAQVVRLAAISRRTDARRKAMIARLDSARAAAPAPGDSARPRGRGPRPGAPPSAELQRVRDQMRADVRDAIAVLTPDQQATAWMMVAGGGPSLGAIPGGPMGPRRGRGPDDNEQQSERGSIGRPPAPRDVPRRPEGAERVQP